MNDYEAMDDDEVEREFERELERFKQEFEENLRKARAMSQTPVDASDTDDDSDLDDHVWARAAELAEGGAREAVMKLPVDVRSYYLTRLFEWLSDADGPDAFIADVPELLDLLPDAYRHLGLPQAAAAAEEYTGAAPTKRLLADPEAMPSDEELDQLNALIEAVGTNDDTRVAFVRARPEIFSLQ